MRKKQRTSWIMHTKYLSRKKSQKKRITQSGPNMATNGVSRQQNDPGGCGIDDLELSGKCLEYS